MRLDDTFVLTPLPAVAAAEAFRERPDPLGPLADLLGTWRGSGFNQIWRPFHDPADPARDRFLQLDVTRETLEFERIPGEIPNRGLLQPDMVMFGMTYLQQVTDANLGAGIHVEPGVWAIVPPTADPPEPQTVVRMASIPHGTTLLAQGVVEVAGGPPRIPAADITPFGRGGPRRFPDETTLTSATDLRTPAAGLAGVTQAMVDDPNSVLRAAVAGQRILSTTVLRVTTNAFDPEPPAVGGGTVNTAFLAGAGDGPNAAAAVVEATFWLETVQERPKKIGARPTTFTQLQYSQTVQLLFNGLSWPHVSVATLRRDDRTHLRELDPAVLGGIRGRLP